MFRLKILFLYLLLYFVISCTKNKNLVSRESLNIEKITCTNSNCEGFYEGPEFINNEDVAHQFSNKMSEKVGEKLKELYHSKNYSKVDFEKIEMSTVGMVSGNVKYKLVIHFVKVANKCDAFTSFDHVGGWNHKPALENRKIQLQNVLQKGGFLNISSLKTTPEGLQEYWIQWKNRDLQSGCN